MKGGGGRELLRILPYPQGPGRGRNASCIRSIKFYLRKRRVGREGLNAILNMSPPGRRKAGREGKNWALDIILMEEEKVGRNVATPDYLFSNFTK